MKWKLKGLNVWNYLLNKCNLVIKLTPWKHHHLNWSTFTFLFRQKMLNYGPTQYRKLDCNWRLIYLWCSLWCSCSQLVIHSQIMKYLTFCNNYFDVGVLLLRSHFVKDRQTDSLISWHQIPGRVDFPFS